MIFISPMMCSFCTRDKGDLDFGSWLTVSPEIPNCPHWNALQWLSPHFKVLVLLFVHQYYFIKYFKADFILEVASFVVVAWVRIKISLIFLFWVFCFTTLFTQVWTLYCSHWDLVAQILTCFLWLIFIWSARWVACTLFHLIEMDLIFRCLIFRCLTGRITPFTYLRPISWFLLELFSIVCTYCWS